jgi:hypothetical protein
MPNIQRFYDEVIVFNDSLIIVALFLIFNKQTKCDIVELKDKLENLEISDSMIDNMLIVQENYTAKEFKLIVKQLTNLDGLIKRYQVNQTILKFNTTIIKKIRKRYKKEK